VNSEEKVTPEAEKMELTCPREDVVTIEVKPRVKGKVFPLIPVFFAVFRRLRTEDEVEGAS